MSNTVSCYFFLFYISETRYFLDISFPFFIFHFISYSSFLTFISLSISISIFLAYFFPFTFLFLFVYFPFLLVFPFLYILFLYFLFFYFLFNFLFFCLILSFYYFFASIKDNAKERQLVETSRLMWKRIFVT